MVYECVILNWVSFSLSSLEFAPPPCESVPEFLPEPGLEDALDRRVDGLLGRSAVPKQKSKGGFAPPQDIQPILEDTEGTNDHSFLFLHDDFVSSHTLYSRQL